MKPELVRRLKLIIIILIVVGVVVSSFFVGKHYYKSWWIPSKCEREQKIKLLEKQLKEYKDEDLKIECMTKTLVAAYNLSKWESHYLSTIFYDFSKNYGIPWEIYPAVVRIESNFKGTLVSPKGAKGMMQILESTAKPVAADLGIKFKESETLWNDFLNVVIGCTYLSNNIQKMGLESGVKGYLGGEAFHETIKKNEEAKKYISEYKTTVWKEYKMVCYIYKGIICQLSNCAEEPLDSLSSIDVSLF